MSPYDKIRQRRADLFAGMKTQPLGARSQPGWGQPQTMAETVRQAIVATRRILSSLPFPEPPAIEYLSLKSAQVNQHMAGKDMGEIDSTLLLKMTTRSASGINVSATIPVLIRSGQVIDPSVMVYNGTPRVLAPSSIASLFRANSIQENPHRPSPFTPPQSAQEARDFPVPQQLWQRPSRGMFASTSSRSTLTAAMRGDVAFMERQAQMTEAVKLLDDWKLPPPSTDEDMQKLLERLTKEHGIDPVDALDAVDIVYEIWTDGSEKTAGMGPPALGDLKMQLLPYAQNGNRVVVDIAFSDKQAPDCSDGYLVNAGRAYLQSQLYRQGFGFIGGLRVDNLDRNACTLTLSFASSVISAPQAPGPSLRVAALAPGQKKDHLDPASRDRDHQAAKAVGDTVALSKDFEVRSRGGSVMTLNKGAHGKVMADVFGDGLHLRVDFAEGSAVVPASFCKAASLKTARTAAAQGKSVEAMVDQIRGLIHRGYGPVDAIVTLRRQHQAAAEPAIARARTLGLILVTRPGPGPKLAS